MATRISVINSEYCLRKSIKLTIDTDNGVTYINDEVIFRVEGPSFTLHSGRVLRDVSDNPVLTLHKELSTTHGRWQVFKHGSTDSDDLLFAVKRSSSRKPHKRNIDLDVFLAKNTEEHVWDFKVNAAGERSHDIRAHGSSTILAKVTNKGAFEVEVQPNVDYAFIVALVMIVDEINNSDNADKGRGETLEGETVEGETLLQGMEMGATILGVIATGAAYVNDMIGGTEEGADVNDTSRATEEGADVNETTGATEEGADLNETIGAMDEGADVNDASGVTEEGADVNDASGAMDEGADVNETTGATEEEGADVNDTTGATEEGADVIDTTGATEEGADDTTGAMEEGADVIDTTGATEEGADDTTGAMEEGADVNDTIGAAATVAPFVNDTTGATDEGADNDTAGATEEGAVLM